MNYRVMVVLLLCVLMVVPFARAESQPQIELGFEGLRVGTLGTVTLRGAEIEAAYAALLGQQFSFFPQGEDVWQGYVAAPIEAEPGFYDLVILTVYEDGREAFYRQEVRVLAGGFTQANLTLTGELQALVDQDIYLDELALLDAYVRGGRAAAGSWQQRGIVAPFTRSISAGFGTYRYVNQTAWQRHTGIDYAIAQGTPIPVMASGRVVAVLDLPLRGQYVLVDHGGGLFSGYAHLLAFHVEVGDFLIPGDSVGTVGNTGRSLGPHLHWEVALGGVWVDPLAVTRRFPPPAAGE